MKDLSNAYLLMIEPKNKAEPVIYDEITELGQLIYNQAIVQKAQYMGCHTCKCSATSDNKLRILPTGHEVNSLMIHYLAQHRSEVPESEIVKLRQIARQLIPGDKLAVLAYQGE